MKKITNYIMQWVLLLTAVASWGQTAVLRLENNAFNSYLNLGIALRSDLLDQGDPGEATLEFWIQSTTPDNEWLLTDLNADEDLWQVRMASSDRLTVSLGTESASLSLTSEMGTNFWHHMALVVSNNAQRLEVYVNAVKRADLNYDLSNDRELYLYKKAGTELLLTEVRGWSDKRTAREIVDNQWLTYASQSQPELDNLESQGLLIYYGKDAFSNNQSVTSLDPLMHSRWPNTMSGSQEATVVNSYDGQSLGEMNTNFDHPILSLDKVLLIAGKGEEKEKVTLSWLHIKNADGYNIFRDEVLIGSLPADGLSISNSIVYTDDQPLANTLYTYKVEGYNNSDPAFSPLGTDEGFIFPNGEIAGSIATEGGVDVEGVELRAAAVNGSIPGSALLFDAGSDPVFVPSIEGFRGLDAFTLQFWYHSNSTMHDLTPFQLGDLSIQFKGSDLEVVQAANVVLTASVKTDQAWHHYTFTFYETGCKIYEDSLLVTSGTQSLLPSLQTVDRFVLNASAPSASWRLDELKVWSDTLSHIEVRSRYDHILSGEEENLLLYYRFDLPGTDHIYNQARDTRGSYVGSGSALKWLTDEAPALVYGGFTQANGSYVVSGIHPGVAADGLDLVVTPDKPNHVFNPTSRQVNLKRSLNTEDYKQTADFTDISSLPVSGKVLYHEGDQVYPVPAGQNILLDGQPVVSTTKDVTTDQSGVYSITSPLGLHTFEVQNTPRARSLGNRSLLLDNGWASTNTVLNGTDQMTFSGWVRRATFDVAPPLQTLLTLGDLKLVLKENKRLAVRNGTDDLLTSQAVLSDDFTFFAFTIDKTAAIVTLYVDETYQKESGISGLSDINLTGLLTLGDEGSESDSVNPFTGHLDQLEIRTEAYDQGKLEKTIKEGEYLSTDATALWLSYTFDGLIGNRAISPTAEGWDHYLDLHEGAERTGEFSAPYSSKYAYDYVASNDAYQPQGPQYELNIVDVISDLHFENTTRFGVVGNIVVPCDNHVGAWTGTIERTDLTEPPFRREITEEHFNRDATVFKIDGLLPGSYSIRLSNAADPTQTLESEIIDVSEGWVNVDFEHRNPLTITTELYEWDTELDTVGALVAPLCDVKYELTTGIEYMVMATVAESYVTSSCPVEGAMVSFDGDMGVLGSGFSFETDADGNVGLVFAANVPNFTGDYTRLLEVTASHNRRDAKSELISYNTGYEQQNNNFTIEEPVVSMILHDPPGDGSSLEVNTSYSFRQEYNYAAGTKIGLDFGFGSGADTEVLAGVGVIKKIAQVAAFVGLGTSSSFTFKTTGGNSVEYTLGQSISTSSDDTFTGLDADVYIGLGTVIQFGTGRSLTVDNCTPVLANDIEVAKFGNSTPFIYTHQDVKDVLLIQLNVLLKDAIALDDQNKIDDYTNQINKWESILAENEAKKAAIASLAGFDYKEEKLAVGLEVADLNVDFGAIEGISENISFSGLTKQTYKYIQKNSGSEGGIFGSSSGLTQEKETEITVFGTKAKFKTKSSIIGLRETKQNNTTTKSGGYSFIFYDDDAGDQFNVDIKKDDRYGTPIFGTNAGQSACPFESGTQPRQGVELVSNTYEVYALAGETAAFELTLRNTQLAIDNTSKEYFIQVDQGDNPKGAIVRYNGDELSDGLSVAFDPDESSPVGVEQQINGQLTIEAPDYNIGDISYPDIPIVMYSGCEKGSYKYNKDELAKVGIKIVDTVYLTVHFKSPCVASIDLKAPADQWVINQTDGDILPLQFALPGLTDTEAPQDLTEIKVEYALEGNSTPILLKTIPVDTLQESYRTDSYIHYDLDVSGLVDGDYRLRLTPQCGLGTEPWRSETSSEWRTGSIYRLIPIITEVYPPDNTVMTSGTISAIYNRALDPGGVNSLNVSLRGILGGLDYVPVSLELDQVTDHIIIPDVAVLDLDSAFTIEFWVYPTAFGNVLILDKGSNYQIGLTAQGEIDAAAFASTESLPPFVWTHIAMVYDGLETVNLFFDGRKVSLAFSNQPFDFVPNKDPLIIGGGFLGRLDEIRIWNTVRNDAEILTNRTRRLLGNEEGLMAYYVLDDSGLEWVNGQGTVIREAIRDYTGHASYTKAQGISWVEGAQAAPLI
ncbi:MAG: LamG-like jellyroll fold domain-containing protein, partial [Bacteroidota bacterium]